jgi:effector-binding domain-containing protein
MLTLRKAQIEQSVQEEMERLRGVEARLSQLDVLQQPDVVLKSAPAQHFLAIREVLPDMEAVKRRVRSITTTIPTIVGQPNLSHMVVLAHAPVYEPTALDVEIGYLLTWKSPDSARLSEEYTLTRRELPAIETLATLIHVGRVNDSHQTYGALGTWIEQNRWQISGAGREILVQLPRRNEEDEAVIEIQYPVSRGPQE